MKIAHIHDLWESIPPTKYGGSERVVASLVEGQIKKGHEVTLYTVASSQTSAHQISVYPRPMVADGIARTNYIWPLLSIIEAIKNENNYDILHFHMNVASDYPALALAKPIKHKTIFTLHFAAPVLKGYPDRDLFLREFADLNYVSISDAQRKGMEYLHWLETVYNGIELQEFSFNPQPQNYFLWLGKFNPDKGAHIAVQAAREAGVPLLLAGAIDKLDEVDAAYYEKEVKPLIDGKQIKYVGEVGGKEKDELFRNAQGFLCPVQWNEPFGLTVAEAMACGTPVIAFNQGAPKEIIENEKSGFVVDSLAQMVEKIKNIQQINRKTCRERIEKEFSADRMVSRYLDLYKKVLN